MDVSIEYCTQLNYLSQATSLAARLKQRFSAQVSLVPSSGGAFEVVADGRPVYSKLETGRFPDEENLLASLAGLV